MLPHFVDFTRKKTLMVFFHPIFPSETCDLRVPCGSERQAALPSAPFLPFGPLPQFPFSAIIKN